MESLEERLTLTASFAGAIHASSAVDLPLTPPLGSAVSVTTIGASTGSAIHGQTVTLTSTVTAAVPGGPAPTGKVSFYDDSSALIGVGTLVNGVATISTSNTFLVGFNSVNAAYWGDSNYAVSDSGYINVQVSLAPTVTTLTTSTSPTAVTFTAQVKPNGPYAGTPTGVVAFYDGGTLVDSVLLVNGKATFTQAMNGSGKHSFTAIYYGDSGFSGSQTKAPTVQALATNPTTSGSDPSSIGLTVKSVDDARGSLIGLGLYAKVTDDQTHLPLPRGTVTFYVNGKAVKTVSVLNGMADMFVPLKVSTGVSLVAKFNGIYGVQSSVTSVTL